MEPTKDVIREVLRAAHLFQNNTSQLAYLLRQLETLQVVSSRSAFIKQLHLVDQVELIQCLTFQVEVIRERQGHVELVQRAVSVLLNFAQDEGVRLMLHETFNVCPVLISLVITYSGLTDDQQTLSDGLLLLQRITYGQRMDYHQTYIEDLLRFLIPHVLERTEALLSPVLGTLANLCRNNMLVQSAVRNIWKTELKKLLKTLCAFFDNQNHLLVIFSLSVFTSLCLNESEGQRIFFDANNVEQTLQIIFGIIKNSFKSVAWKYASDLLTDLLRHPQMQICIRRFSPLPKYVDQILSLLSSGSEEYIADIFELLLSLSVIPSVRTVVSSKLFVPLAEGSITTDHLLEATHKPLVSNLQPLVSCVHWASQKVVHRNRIPCLALDLLVDSCQNVICETERAYPIHLLLPVVVDMLSQPEQIHARTLRLIRLVSVLNTIDLPKEVLSAHFKVSMVKALIHNLTSYKSVVIPSDTNLVGVEHNAKDDSHHCVLVLLDLVMKVHKFIPGLTEYLQQILKETELVDILAVGLTSASQELVEISIRLLCFMQGLDNIRPDVILCGSIACMNKEKQSSSKRPLADVDAPKRVKVTADQVLKGKENRPCTQHSVSSIQPDQKSRAGLDNSNKEDLSVDSLIERMQSLIGPKDTKTTEVIEVFEHHIRSLQIKEEHLNNLLEAKSLALTQADRVIAQLRSRQASHSAEMNKLQHVLKESERRIDQIVTKMNDSKIQTEQMKFQFETQLESKTEELETLCREKDEVTERCAEFEDRLKSCRQENKTLSSMMSSLQDAHEALKEQYNTSVSQNKQLEEDRKTLSKQLKDKDAVLQKQTSTLQALQTKYKETAEEKAELEKEKENIEAYVDKLQHQLSASEGTCRQLQQQVSVLESVNRDLEEKLKQKSDKVEELEAELDKHNQIVSFINNMQLRNNKK